MKEAGHETAEAGPCGRPAAEAAGREAKEKIERKKTSSKTAAAEPDGRRPTRNTSAKGTRRTENAQACGLHRPADGFLSVGRKLAGIIGLGWPLRVWMLSGQDGPDALRGGISDQKEKDLIMKRLSDVCFAVRPDRRSGCEPAPSRQPREDATLRRPLRRELPPAEGAPATDGARKRRPEEKTAGLLTKRRSKPVGRASYAIAWRMDVIPRRSGRKSHARGSTPSPAFGSSQVFALPSGQCLGQPRGRVTSVWGAGTRRRPFAPAAPAPLIVGF